MRDNLERVTIVLGKEQHQRYKDYSKKYHSSVSQFLRHAAENEMNQDNGVEELMLRPIFERLEKTNTDVQIIQRTLQKLEKEIDSIAEQKRRKDEYIANHIEELLLSSRTKLSIPEIAGYLPYEQEAIIRGIEKLEERFIITRIKQVNGISKWMIQGDSNYNH